MAKAIVHCGVEEYAIEVGGVRSDPEEYGDPIVLVADGARYVALIAEIDRARTSLFGSAYIVKIGPDVPCTFTSYDETEDYDGPDSEEGSDSDDEGDGDDDAEEGEGEEEDPEEESDPDNDNDEDDGEDSDPDSDADPTEEEEETP